MAQMKAKLTASNVLTFLQTSTIVVCPQKPPVIKQQPAPQLNCYEAGVSYWHMGPMCSHYEFLLVSAAPQEAEDVEEEVDEVQIEGEGTEDGEAAG